MQKRNEKCNSRQSPSTLQVLKGREQLAKENENLWPEVLEEIRYVYCPRAKRYKHLEQEH